jgi:hypothetical protein
VRIVPAAAHDTGDRHAHLIGSRWGFSSKGGAARDVAGSKVLDSPRDR